MITFPPHTQLGSQLTSPVTMYFPSGEKARALRDFLVVRNEVDHCSTEGQATSFAMTMLPIL